MITTLFALLLWGCGEKPVEPGAPAEPAPPVHDHAKMLRDQAAAGEAPGPMPAAEPVRDTSIYQLPVALTDASGAAAALGAWKGHPVLISMVYTSCTAACPLIVSDMKGVDAALSPAAREQMRYLLVSLDPARDTTEALATLARTHQLDDRWRVTRTDADGVRQIAAVLGLRYRKLADGNFNHSAVLTLLDPDGVIDTRIDGLGLPNTELVAHAEAMAAAAKPGASL